MIEISQEEKNKIAELILKLGFVPTGFLEKGINYYIEEYKRLVKASENNIYNESAGYEEYTNDIVVRTIIETVIDAVSNETKKKILEVIEPFDNKLRRTFRHEGKFILNKRLVKKFPERKYWWYWGGPYPKF